MDRDLNRLRGLLNGAPPTLILCDNEGQLERLDELLDEGGRGGTRATLAIGALDGGFVMPSLRVLTDHEIFRRARRLRRARRYRQAAPSLATGALTMGDYVVHLDHGIGIYRGIQTIMVGESTLEVAIVEYEGGDRLNVPLYRLDQLERYRAAGEDGDRPPPRIHRLGGSSLAAGAGEDPRRRSSRWRPSCSISTPGARSPAGIRSRPTPSGSASSSRSFLYEDTPDQRKATEEVKTDMERPLPDGPAAGGRRRLRQDRDRGARGVQGGAGRQAGGGAGADDDSGGAARPHLHRAAGRLSGQDRGALPLPHGARSRRRRSRGWPTARPTS